MAELIEKQYAQRFGAFLAYSAVPFLAYSVVFISTKKETTRKGGLNSVEYA